MDLTYLGILHTSDLTYLSSAVHFFGPLDHEVNRWIGLILSVLLYGKDSWTLSCPLESRLDNFCNRIIGYSQWDHVSNQRLHRETGLGPVTCTVCDCKLRLYGHLARFPQDGPVHQVNSVQDSHGLGRLAGRPRKLCLTNGYVLRLVQDPLLA